MPTFAHHPGTLAAFSGQQHDFVYSLNNLISMRPGRDEHPSQCAIEFCQHKIAGRFHILLGKVAQMGKEVDLVLAASPVGARAEIINLITVVPPIHPGSAVARV
jgi:hypothetical protein